MFVLICTIIYTPFLIAFIIKLSLDVKNSEENNLMLSCQIDKLARENSRLRKENENVLPIERKGTKNNKKSTKLHHD
jgi:hypothetical protein